MSGIDKQFDYSVPPPLGPMVRPGAVVRVELHGRRVDAWVIGTGTEGSPGFDEITGDRLLPLLSIADLAIPADVMPLCEWVAATWAGPLRTVLASATPRRKRARAVNPRRGSFTVPDNEIAAAVLGAWDDGGAAVCVPPLASALDVVVACAGRGPVLVLCPTLRMARLGAAALRRRGLTTAELPEDADSAAVGVDVVIGARSAAFAACEGMSSIVVIDEHEESYHEERVPTWSGPAVAVERARRASVPVFLVSPVPSVWAEKKLGPARTTVDGRAGWPAITVVDLSGVPVRGSLLSTELLARLRDARHAVLCVLNTKGTARLVACKACRELQACTSCGSTVERNDGVLECRACGMHRPAVCSSCGRTAFVTVRAGTGRLTQELSAASRLPVVEVTASTEGVGGAAAVYVGTEALLHRASSAELVVFLDVDRDLAAPRMTSGREVLAAVARASRIVGRTGGIIIQTRRPSHPLVAALADGNPDAWRALDAANLRQLGLPPFVNVARCTADGQWGAADVPEADGVEWSVDGATLIARSASLDALLGWVARVRGESSARVRVEINPPRI